jgi:hypothetical protein
LDSVRTRHRRSEMTMSRAVYEIRVAGEVPTRIIEDFGLTTLSVDPVGTTMRAEVVDESELHGILDALRRERLVLVDVRRELAYDASDRPEGGADPDPG